MANLISSCVIYLFSISIIDVDNYLVSGFPPGFPHGFPERRGTSLGPKNILKA
jgi:hypothetical protein